MYLIFHFHFRSSLPYFDDADAFSVEVNNSMLTESELFCNLTRNPLANATFSWILLSNINFHPKVKVVYNLLIDPIIMCSTCLLLFFINFTRCYNSSRADNENMPSIDEPAMELELEIDQDLGSRPDPLMTTSPSPSPKSRSSPQTQQNNLLNTNFVSDKTKFYLIKLQISFIKLCTVFLCIFTSFLRPGLLCMIYFIYGSMEIYIWTVHIHSKLLPYHRRLIFLRFYAAAHFCLIYFYQFPGLFYFWPRCDFYSRLLGLPLIISNEHNQYGFRKLHSRNWIDYVLALSLIFIYLLSILPLQTDPNKYFYQLNRCSSAISTYHTDVYENHSKGEKTAIVNDCQWFQTDEPNQEIMANSSNLFKADSLMTGEMLMKNMINILVKHNFVPVFISMLLWSVTYLSYLTFILLLWGCILWIVPKAFSLCLPLLVVYCSFVFGLTYFLSFDRLVLAEIPNLKSIIEIGFSQVDEPFSHLCIQFCYLLVFFFAWHLEINQTKRNSRSASYVSYMKDSIELYDLFHALLTNRVVFHACKLLGSLTKLFVNRFWFIICILVPYCVSLSSDYNGFNLVYVILILFFMLIFLLSYDFWYYFYRLYSWLFITYSLLVICCIHSYQFPYFFQRYLNDTNINQILRDVGLHRYDKKKDLLYRLASPLSYIILLIFQMNYFNKGFIVVKSKKKVVESENMLFFSMTDLIGFLLTGVKGAVNNEQIEGKWIKRLRIVTKIRYIIFWFIEIKLIYVIVSLALYCALDKVTLPNIVCVTLICCLFPNRTTHSILAVFLYVLFAYQLITELAFQVPLFQTHMEITCKNASQLGSEFHPLLGTSYQLKPYRLVIISSVLMTLILRRGLEIYNCAAGNTYRNREFDVVFPERKRWQKISRLKSGLKHIVNFYFYIFGLEVCFTVSVTVAFYRQDIYGLIYMGLLIPFIFIKRRFSQIFWLPYCFIIGITYVFQYVLFFSKSTQDPCMRKHLFKWYENLVIPYSLQTDMWILSAKYLPISSIYGDTAQLIIISYQSLIFQSEKKARRSSFVNNKISGWYMSKENDFISFKKRSWDYLTHAFFSWTHRIFTYILCIVSAPGDNILQLIGIFFGFIALYLGHTTRIYRQANINRVWTVAVLIFLIFLIKTLVLNYVDCLGFIENIIQNKNLRLAVKHNLLQAQCPQYILSYINKSAEKFEDDVKSLIFFILILWQRRILRFQEMNYLFLELVVSIKFSSRAACLRRLMKSVRESLCKTESDKMLNYIEETLLELEKQKKQFKKGLVTLNEHFLVIRSGDYFMFDKHPWEEDGKEFNKKLLKGMSDLPWEKDLPSSPPPAIKRTKSSSSALVLVGESETSKKKNKRKEEKKIFRKFSGKKNIQIILEKQPTTTSANSLDINDTTSAGAGVAIVEYQASNVSSTARQFLEVTKRGLRRFNKKIIQSLEEMTSDYRLVEDVLHCEKRTTKEILYEKYFPILDFNHWELQNDENESKKCWRLSMIINDLMDLDHLKLHETLVKNCDSKGKSIDYLKETKIDYYCEMKDYKKNRGNLFSFFSFIHCFTRMYLDYACFIVIIIFAYTLNRYYFIFYPMTIFTWGLFSIPKPNQLFWFIMIAFTEVCMVVEFIQQIINKAVPSASFGSTISCFINLIIILCGLFAARFNLICCGFWRYHERTDVADKTITGLFKRRASEVFSSLVRYVSLMKRNNYNNSTDLYRYLFLCEICSLLIIFMGYRDLGLAEDYKRSIYQIFSESSIPISLVIHAAIQFCFIFIDRIVYLRKSAFAKFLFQIVQVFSLHIYFCTNLFQNL